MRKPHPLYRPVFAAAVALAMTTLVACNRAETPMEAPAAPPPNSAPAEAPPVMPTPPSASTESAAPSTTMGEKIDDTVITTKVKTALLADEAVKGADISVTTVAGEVQLSGAVASQAQIDRAVEVAKGVEGVLRVQNGVTLKP
ncbi:BON domain-containing protein [Hydrogenophaga palleronii]|uniref:BON domain-containing protein n=1 Tax=Hydrogenophaga palleronii TaxID=65655 RepID=UPI000A706200|nr:BON domain-containing protein [Hydrogenophaga palleronii]